METQTGNIRIRCTLPLRLPRLQQPTHNTCQSTAIAILAGAREKDLPMWVEAIHKPYFEDYLPTGVILKHLGMPFIIPPADNRIILDDHVYLETVPSLNIEGGFHSIVATILDGAWDVVIDPGKGREGRKYYVRAGEGSENPLAVSFSSGIVEAYCSVKDLWVWQSNNPPITHGMLLDNFTRSINNMLSMP